MMGEPMKVKVGGQDVTDYQYDAAAGELTLLAAPLDGVAIDVTYKPADARITHYNAVAGSLAKAKQGVSAKASDGTLLTMTVDGSQLVFNEDDVTDGRAVTVTYDYGDRDTELQYELAHDPIDGTLTVERADEASSRCIKDIAVSGREVSFHCDGEELGEVKAIYDFVAERYRSFTVPADGSRSDAMWQVFVDGSAVTFTRDGNVVTVADRDVPGDGSIVRVMVTTK
jgi:hypothetical protein